MNKCWISLAVLVPLYGQMEAGKSLFMTHCAQCHGPDGEGGRGPSIAVAKLPRAPDDQALTRLIRRGIPGSEMPDTRDTIVPDDQLQHMIAYIRSLGKRPAEPVTGDAKHGREIYYGKGNCGACHTISGYGTALGPDLADVGSKRSLSWLRLKLAEPQAAVPESFLMLEIETKDGRGIAGIRLNEDTFSIQVRELSGRIHSFWKRDVASIDRQTGKTPMPGYRDALSEDERNDLLAFLVSMKGSI